MACVCREAGPVSHPLGELGKGGRAERKGDTGQGNEGSSEEPLCSQHCMAGCALQPVR